VGVALLCLASAAWAEKRVALVIGNSAYASAPLRNPSSDARLMGQSLQAAGFDVAVLVDVDQKGMKRAILDLGARIEAAGKDTVGLFYYAGHGVQVAGNNYLIPVDAQIEHERDIAVEAVPASDVSDMLAFAQNRLNLVVLDACRNNPFASGSRSGTRGLARMDAPAGTLIAYATAPGDVALDGDAANSPYTRALSAAIREPGLPVEMVFKQTRLSVQNETGKRQTPWESSSLTGDFYFTPGAAPAASAAVAPAAAASDHEVVFWDSIKGSSNPESFQAFLRQYPDGSLAELARVRLRELQGPADTRSLNRRRLAFSQELDVEIFAEYAALDWCAPELRLRFEAADPAVFRGPGFPPLVAKLTKVIRSQCGKAQSAELYGYARGSSGVAYRGALRAADNWRLQ
jgi:uncharacterized caspase-like protein